MRFKKALATTLCALALSYSTANNASEFRLPDLGTSAVQVLPIEKEQAIGEVMMMQIRSSSPLVQDPVLNEYLSALGNKLVASANDVRFPFKFFWLNNKAINAFAFYGGHVGVHTGLIAQSDNESQLASVLGHEIAHVTQRHLARRIQQAKDNSALTIAGMITGILATVVAPDAGMAILAANSTQAALSQLTHSRKAEQEADRFGMQTLQKAGYDPYAASEFLTKLASQVRFKNKPPAFLLTHPLPDSRVSDVRLRAQQYPKRYVPSSEDFHYAQNRVMARYQLSKEDAQAYFENTLRTSTELDKSHYEYGLAISLLDQKKYDQAEGIINKLLKLKPNNLFFLDVYTDIKLGQKKYDQALSLLEQKHQLRPNNQVITLNLANTAIKAKMYEKAEQLLKVFLLEKPNHVLAKQLLTETYELSENKAAYHESRASLLSHYGAFMKAADEVQKALNFIEKEDEIKKLRLKALLTKYRGMQKELAKL
ncbi:M48 family metalloprotease [Pseudoalteromonas luteoviolacea]|uniref:Putative beta-barrel assembly-enhancing protease n=1 Tax=Pseudoalteromonas luteoviolacea (strain 2ta16) TaxID=1353533 RepID=V4HJA3_PSEL2|nr:M48 family metalloprotease [Pseudoalteromonas luteoviolacea]ESP90880.1 putative Zn-dependent protease [Pseudoalteromonas luteoviolacea 2ta16]KZN38363.1 protease [Pseudoalteromonas luteoviolacea NCIMB 1944]